MSGNSCASSLQTAPIVSDLPAGAPATEELRRPLLGRDRFGLGLGHRARYVSLYLPICSSSPSSSLCESIRRRFT